MTEEVDGESDGEDSSSSEGSPPKEEG